MRRVVLYGKAGCCLCDEARGAVASARERHDFDLTEVDVSLDPGLAREYGERVPVLSLDGEELFEFHVDADELVRRLQSAG